MPTTNWFANCSRVLHRDAKSWPPGIELMNFVSEWCGTCTGKWIAGSKCQKPKVLILAARIGVYHSPRGGRTDIPRYVHIRALGLHKRSSRYSRTASARD